jgi:nucleotide-binding universal stress UspA family protein
LVKELVVGVDGSEQSRLALQWAAALGRATGARLAVVEAWSGGDPATADETGERIKRELVGATAALLGEQGTNLDIDFEALRGSAAGAILERVTPESGLVLGSRGRGGFAGLLLGSVSRECIEHASCPVMVIRHERALPNRAAPILVGHDGSPTSARALEWAVALADAIEAEVVAAHVWQATSSEVRPRLHRRLSSAARESVDRWAKDVSPAVRPQDVEGEARMELVSLAQRLGAGVLVVGRRGAGKVRALRMGSVASYLVTSSPVPIAVIPPAPDTDLS